MKDTMFWPGLLFTAILGWGAIQIQQLELMQRLHLSSLIIAILLGIVINNTVKLPQVLSAGMRFSAKRVLRLAIILLGFKLSFAEVAQVGAKGLILVILTTGCTMFFAYWLGKRLGLDEKLALLVGAGTAICGASAVAAVGPVVKAEEKDTTFAIATVTIFGTVAMFLYPVFYRLLELPDLLYSLWAGSSIHEVAQVVAAGFAAGEQTGQFATLVKLTRVLLLIPVTLILGIRAMRQSRRDSSADEGTSVKGAGKLPIPWFVFGFLAVVVVNSLQVLPQAAVSQLVKLDAFLLTWAMAGLGLETSLAKMKQVGLSPFYAGFLMSVFISVLGFVAAKILLV